VARRADPDARRAAGADVVLEDLSAIRVEGAEEQADEGRSIEALPDALARLDDVMAEIADRRVALFLDFDGTLAPIVDHPDRAAVPEETRALLADVASRRAVAVVSGRDLDDLRSRIDVDDVYYAGSHGFRLAGPDGWSREQPRARAFLPALEEAAKALEEALATREGVEIERKRYAVAVHHRRAPADAEEEVRREVEAVCERSDGALRVGEGRSVLELRPAIDWDKGSAVGWMREELGLAGADVCPVYLGDDVTDEDAFRVVAEDGLAVVVRGRSGRTRARYALADPAAVGRFLARLDERLGSP